MLLETLFSSNTLRLSGNLFVLILAGIEVLAVWQYTRCLVPFRGKTLKKLGAILVTVAILLLILVAQLRLYPALADVPARPTRGFVLSVITVQSLVGLGLLFWQLLKNRNKSLASDKSL